MFLRALKLWTLEHSKYEIVKVQKETSQSMLLHEAIGIPIISAHQSAIAANNRITARYGACEEKSEKTINI